MTASPNFSVIRPRLDRIILLWPICGMLLLLSVGLGGHFDVRYVVNLFIYGLLIGTISLILSGFRDRSYGSLFLVAIIIRFALVVMLEAFPPDSPPSALLYVPGVVFEDETYYLDTASWLGQSLETIRSIDISNPYERVAGYYGVIHLVVGPERIWGRLLNTLIGGLTAVVIYDFLSLVVGHNVKKFIRWFAALSPVLVFWSASYLKEAILAFGVALVVNSIVRIYLRRIGVTLVLMLVFGAAICFWVRSVMFLPLLPPLLLSVFVFLGKKRRDSFAFVPTIIVLTVIFTLIIMSPLDTAKSAAVLVGGEGLGPLYISSELQEATPDIRFPFFDKVMQWTGPFRILGLSLLLMISPVITSLWSLLPVIGKPSWASFGVAAYAFSWWICLPFWIRCFYHSVRRRNTWWLIWGGVFILWLMMAAYARLGAGFDAFRYRDAMVPVVMLLAAKGLAATLPEWRKKRIWPLMLRAYFIMLGLLILLRGIGILRLT